MTWEIAVVLLSTALGVAARVHWLGRIARAQMPRYLSSLDALVLPSRSIPTWQEQFGAVLVEAMYCATAVVGSSSGAIPEVIGEAGLVFPEEDPAGLAACLLRLRDDPGLRGRLAEAGRQRALSTFALPVYVERLLTLFAEALGEPPTAEAGCTR